MKAIRADRIARDPCLGADRVTARVMIGFPCGASVTVPFNASLLALQAYELVQGELRLLTEIQHASSPLVGENRTALVEYFLSSSADWLLQIDTDVSFPPTLIETMLSLAGDERRVLAASIPPGTKHGATSAYARSSEAGAFRPIRWVPLTPIEAHVVDAGVLLVHRSVFEAIAKREGRTWFHHMYLPASRSDEAPIEERRFDSLGEDYAFCVRARRAGARIWCVYIPGVKHHKARPLSHDDEDQLFYRAWYAAGAPVHGCALQLESPEGPVTVNLRKLSVRELEQAREISEDKISRAAATLFPTDDAAYDRDTVLRAGVESWTAATPPSEGVDDLDEAAADRQRSVILDLSLPRQERNR